MGSTPDGAPPAGDPSGDAKTLCARLRQGERIAFREFYARYAQPTFRFLLRLSGQRAEAEDLHQETWLAAARHAGRLAADSDLAAWIFTIARNRFLSAQRPRGPAAALAPSLVARTLAAAGPGDDDPACHDLLRALAALPEGHREILLLVGVEALTVDQAAVVLQLRPDAARQRLARARAALSASLGAAAEAVDATPLQRRG